MNLELKPLDELYNEIYITEKPQKSEFQETLEDVFNESRFIDVVNVFRIAREAWDKVTIRGH